MPHFDYFKLNSLTYSQPLAKAQQVSTEKEEKPNYAIEQHRQQQEITLHRVTNENNTLKEKTRSLENSFKELLSKYEGLQKKVNDLQNNRSKPLKQETTETISIAKDIMDQLENVKGMKDLYLEEVIGKNINYKDISKNDPKDDIINIIGMPELFALNKQCHSLRTLVKSNEAAQKHLQEMCSFKKSDFSNSDSLLIKSMLRKLDDYLIELAGEEASISYIA
jgi:hypothetical protein